MANSADERRDDAGNQRYELAGKYIPWIVHTEYDSGKPHEQREHNEWSREIRKCEGETERDRHCGRGMPRRKTEAIRLANERRVNLRSRWPRSIDPALDGLDRDVRHSEHDQRKHAGSCEGPEADRSSQRERDAEQRTSEVRERHPTRSRARRRCALKHPPREECAITRVEPFEE